jgi:hypothetical protein
MAVRGYGLCDPDMIILAACPLAAWEFSRRAVASVQTAVAAQSILGWGVFTSIRGKR